MRKSIRANLVWALGYNVIALALAAAGFLQPVIAAGLMAGSSLLVVFRSLRANREASADVPPRSATETVSNLCRTST